MAVSRNRIRTAVVATLVAMGVGGALIPAQSRAATSYYLDVNGNTGTLGLAANNSTFSWDANNVWNTSSTGAVNPASWVAGGFARFTVGASAVTYTVTVANSESMAGLFQTTAGTLNINQAASTTGNLNITAVGGPIQGFLATGTLIINAPITGAGGISNSQAGSLYLYGSNSYSGGTGFASSSGLNYNNNNSFGTGPFSFTGATTGVLADPGATAPITLNNAFNGSASTTVLITGAQPTTFTGAWTMTGTSTISIGNGSFPNTINTISGGITGASANIIKAGTGTLIVSGSGNTYNGTTTVTAGTLRLGSANTIADSSSVILNGGILDPDGLTQSMSATTLGMTASSTLTYALGNTEVDFKNSSAVAWTGTLNLTNWSNFTLLRFGTDGTGLTSAQLADIEFNGVAGTKGTAMLTADGYVVPEPTTVAMLLLGAPMLAARRRR